MKKLSYLIVLALILSLVLTGCLLSNVGQVPTTEQSGITYLTKGLPFSDNLVGLWSFDGNADDSSGNNNHGTLNNFTGVFWVDDQWGGQALGFDGMDDYVDCGNDASLNITTAITIEAWVYPRSAGRNNYGRITDKHPAPCLLVGPNGQLRWFGDIGGASVDKAVCTGCVSWNSWHHLALTYDMNEAIPTIRGYVDGELKGTITGYSGPLSTTSVHLAIGNSLEDGTAYYLNRAFDGLIDEVRIYDYALLPGTIEAHAAGIYGFNGLMAPYAPPDKKAFKAGSTIPLKWQYTDSAGAVDSSNAKPEVGWIFMGEVNGSDILEEEDAPGASGLRYDALTMTWQFNWQTAKSFTAGQYDIYIKSNQTGQTDGPFPIQLK